MAKKRVVILGGGVGGMSAAHELIERDFNVEVHELKKVPGGKARTIYVEGSGTGGRTDLPGEHGFRFFPGFYRHVTDTMKRIPFGGQPRGVFDNLLQASEYLLATSPAKDLTLLARFPESAGEWVELFMTLFQAPELGIPADELAYFASRLLVILTSCRERRLAEYEKIAWWDFIQADTKSEAYKLYLAVGLTRSLVALRAQEASTRTVGDILIQLLLDIYAPGVELDRLLNGPTTEVWLDPWLAHLEGQGVAYHRASRVVEIQCLGGEITGVVVEDAGGVKTIVTGDYYVSALPVEQLVPLVSAAMKAADPGLGLLENLRVAWMNGIQFFLKQDAPLVKGHGNFVATASALTSISTAQFWRRPLTEYGDGSVRGLFSVDISDWEQPGIVYHLPLRQLTTRDQIKDEVQAQILGALRPDFQAVVAQPNLASWFLDPDIQLPAGSPATNLEPLLINTADSWQYRPEAATRIHNLFLAADYVRTYTDLATMEGANEAARRAVNAILMVSSSAAPLCKLWPLEEPLIFLPAREVDLIRFKLGLPHVKLAVAAPALPVPQAAQIPAAEPPMARVAHTVTVKEVCEGMMP